MKEILKDIINWIKKRKFVWILFLIFFILFSIGIKQLINQKIKKENLKVASKKALELYKKELEKYPEFKDLMKILDPKNTLAIEKQFYTLLRAELLSSGVKKIEIEAQLLKEIQDILKNIVVDETKSNFEYANEFRKEIEKIKLINLDFKDKNNLAMSGEFILNVAKNLSNIKPTKNYYEFHKGEVLLLAMMGKALIKLANTNDYEEAIALSLILNNLADLQEEILKRL